MTKMASKCSGWCCRWGRVSDSTTVCMVTICLIQGLLWSAFAVFLLAVQTCALEIECPDNIRNSSTNFTYVVNLIHAAYLSGSCSMQKVDVLMTQSTTDRTYNLLVIHGFLNAVWIPISVLLIVGILSRLRGCCVLPVIYIPWLLVTFAVVAFDLFSASLYVEDVEYARTLRSFLLYIRFKASTDNIIPEYFQSDVYTIYAPLSVIFYFTRGVIFTIFNVTTFFFVLGLMISLCRERKFAPKSGLFLDEYDEIYSPIITNEVENIPLQAQDKMMENYYTTDLAMGGIQVKPGRKDVYQNRNRPVHDYLTLIQTPVYQHVYEDIWRDIKKEKLVYSNTCDRLYNKGNTSIIEPVSPVYDYLGRPVLEYKVATQPKCNAVVEETIADVCRTSKVDKNHNIWRRTNLFVPPALPPSNVNQSKKNMLVASTIPLQQQKQEQPLSFAVYESISSYYEKSNQSYDYTDGDDASELYSSVHKVPSLSEKKSTMSFEESTDSVYCSGSSVDHYGTMQTSSIEANESIDDESNYNDSSTRKCCHNEYECTENCNDYNYIEPFVSSKKCNSPDFNCINSSDSSKKSETREFDCTEKCNNGDNNYIVDPNDNNEGCDPCNSVSKHGASEYSDNNIALKATDNEICKNNSNSNSNCSSESNSNDSIDSDSKSSSSERRDSNTCENKTSKSNQKVSFKEISNVNRSVTEDDQNIESRNSKIGENNSCGENFHRPEPPDMSKLTSHHLEQNTNNKKNLPPLTIKPLAPKIEINSSDQEAELRARL